MTLSLQISRVHFDFGAIATLPAELHRLGVTRPLFVTDQGIVAAGVFEPVRRAMATNAAIATFDAIPENPTVAGVEAARMPASARALS